MKILVIGASGGTGTQLLKKLLAAGHEVTAFVRNPKNLVVQDPHLHVAIGEARDLSSLEKAVQGQDAVMSAFGPRTIKKGDLQEALMKNLIAAMSKAGVKRLVNLSAMGAGVTREGAPFVMRKIILPFFLNNLFIDKDRGEKLLFASPLEYVNVRPGRLVNTRGRGGVKAGLDYQGLKALMSREDLAEFMIAQLESRQWVRQSPLIGY